MSILAEVTEACGLDGEAVGELFQDLLNDCMARRIQAGTADEAHVCCACATTNRYMRGSEGDLAAARAQVEWFRQQGVWIGGAGAGAEKHHVIDGRAYGADLQAASAFHQRVAYAAGVGPAPELPGPPAEAVPRVVAARGAAG